MRYKTLLVLSLINIILLSACTKINSDQADGFELKNANNETKLTHSGQPTVLGKKIPMYCGIENVKKLYARYKAQKESGSNNRHTETSGGTSGCGDPEPNFMYVRFLPADEDELIELDELGLDLYEEPMDFEVQTPGDYYQDPSLPDSAITWMYTVVPIDYQLPATIQSQILAKVFLFNTEREQPEPDEYEDGYEDEYGQSDCYGEKPFIENGQVTSCRTSTRWQIMNDAYDCLTSQGIDADDFELELMHEMGYHGDDYDDNSRNGNTGTGSRLFGGQYRPEGNITVEDNDIRDIGNRFPVKGVMVKSRNFLRIKRTYTNAQGHFFIDRGYRKKAQIIIKWKNRGAVTRGIDNWFKIWDLIFPVRDKIGWFAKNDLRNVNKHYPYDANERSIAAERWTASHYMNSLFETYEQSTVLGIPRPPEKMRVYLVERWFNGSAFTPMFSRTFGRGFPIGNFNDLLQLKLGRFIGTTLKKLFLKNAPDIFIPDFQTINGTRSTQNAADLINTSYHETGHSIHYRSVGGNYWKQYTYPAYGYNLVAYGGDYGPKTGPYAPFVAVTEMWGFYFGNTMTVRKYRGIGSTDAGIIWNRNLLQLENNIPDDNINVIYFANGSRSWIPLGFPHDMTDVGENFAITNINDNADAYDVNRVYRGMATGVIDICGYTVATLNTNSSLQSAAVIDLQNQYRWGCCLNCKTLPTPTK